MNGLTLILQLAIRSYQTMHVRSVPSHPTTLPSGAVQPRIHAPGHYVEVIGDFRFGNVLRLQTQTSKRQQLIDD